MSIVSDMVVSPPALGARAPAAAWGARWRELLRRLFVMRWHLWALLAITALGGFLRFYKLTNPALWGDEGLTFHRTTTDYRELLDKIQSDGFTPLHYEFYWWMGKGMPIGSWAVKPGGWPMNALQMRLPVAIAGFFMVPGMYFLARQVVGKKTALVAALFAACSAYLLVYSRDAKMYMPFWLFLTLHMGCLLWWLRVNTRRAWLAWIATGVAAMGLHPSGIAILLVEPLLAFTSRRIHWKHALLVIIGLAIVGSAPAGYYLGFNRWAQKTGGFVPEANQDDEEKGNWGASGIEWVRGYQAGRNGPELVLHTATAFLYSWEWPKDSQVTEIEPTTNEPVIPPIVMTLGTLSFAALVTVFVLGALPWPRRLRPREPGDPAPWWRKLLWLSLWLVLPTYGVFYCRSIHDFSPPSEWIDYVAALWAGYWWYVLGGIVVLAAALMLLRPRPLVLAMILVAITGTMALLTFLLEPGSNTPRAPEFARSVGQTLVAARHWLLAAGVILFVPLCWYCSGRTLLWRLKKTAILLGIVASLYVACYGCYQFWSQHKQGFREAFERDNPGVDWELAWKRKCSSVWMPRYLGFIWPAVAIGAAALVMRLPTRPVRLLGIALLLAPNVANGWQRIDGESEPPVDRMAADILLAQERDSPVRTFCSAVGGGAHPGDGSMRGAMGLYYLAVGKGLKPAWYEFRPEPRHARFRGNFVNQFRIRTETSAPAVAQSVSSASQVNRVIVWQRYDSTVDAYMGGPTYGSAPKPTLEYQAFGWFGVPVYRDDILEALGPGWTRKSWETIHVRQHWSWRDRGICWRREYVKQ